MTTLYPPEANNFLSIDELCKPSIQFFVAENDGVPVGCIALADMDGYGEIKSLFVDDAARGLGVGKSLMDTLETHARENGIVNIKLETGDTLYAAQRLYARHGYTVCGPYGDYSEGPHSVFMEKTLG